MRFGVVVGNPPYQRFNREGSAKGCPLYGLFFERFKRFSGCGLSLVIPARWYCDGRNMDGFRERFLNDDQVSVLIDFPDLFDVFESAVISGGVCVFYRGVDRVDACRVQQLRQGEQVYCTDRVLSEFDVFVRDVRAVSVIRKVQAKADRFLSESVFARDVFGLPSNTGFIDGGDIVLKRAGGKGAFRRDLVGSRLDLVDRWKVSFSHLKHGRGGSPDREGRFKVWSNLEILPPGMVCTDTFIVGGVFSTEGEAERFASFLWSKFARFLLLQGSITQNVSRVSFRFVPVVPEGFDGTDEFLYDYFGLSEEERALIEGLIV